MTSHPRKLSVHRQALRSEPAITIGVLDDPATSLRPRHELRHPDRVPWQEDGLRDDGLNRWRQQGLLDLHDPDIYACRVNASISATAFCVGVSGCSDFAGARI